MGERRYKIVINWDTNSFLKKLFPNFFFLIKTILIGSDLPCGEGQIGTCEVPDYLFNRTKGGAGWGLNFHQKNVAGPGLTPYIPSTGPESQLGFSCPLLLLHTKKSWWKSFWSENYFSNVRVAALCILLFKTGTGQLLFLCHVYDEKTRESKKESRKL